MTWLYDKYPRIHFLINNGRVIIEQFAPDDSHQKGWDNLVLTDTMHTNIKLTSYNSENDSSTSKTLSMLAWDFHGLLKTIPCFVEWSETFDFVFICKLCSSD